MKSPFKFLDAYTYEDKEIFFGRDREIEEIYDKVNRGKTLLIYGQSGTGKTSLVQCGLANKFDHTDWFPIFIRRKETLNKALTEALDKYTEEGIGDDIAEQVQDIFEEYLRPIYLIFDQFEELFILGSHQEQEKFFNSIKKLVDANLPCRVLFIVREEFISYLYDFERQLPNLFDWRVRVENMTQQKIKEVISKSLKNFNITLENEGQNLNQIIDNLKTGKSGFYLPYLQVYLDMLYREDFTRTYPEAVPAEAFPALEFTTTEIREFGEISDVLDRFLEEQSHEISGILKQKDWAYTKDTIYEVLDGFVTEEGTKRPIAYTRDDNERIVPDSDDLRHFPPVKPEHLVFIFEELERRRILRAEDQNIELPHDILAQRIDLRRSDDQRLLNEAMKRLKYNLEEHKKTGIFLTDKQLGSLENYIPRLSLEPEVQQFIEESRAKIKKDEAEKERLQKEELEREREQAIKERQLREEAEGALATAQEAREREKKALEAQIETEQNAIKRQRKNLWIIGGIALVAGVLGVFSAVSASRLQQASAEKVQLARANFDQHFETAREEMSRTDYGSAIKELNLARSSVTFDTSSFLQELADIDQLLVETQGKFELKAVYDSLIIAGDRILGNDRLRAVLYYKQAMELGEFDNQLVERVRSEVEKMEPILLDEFTGIVRRSNLFFENSGRECQYLTNKNFNFPRADSIFREGDFSPTTIRENQVVFDNFEKIRTYCNDFLERINSSQ